MRKIRRWVIGWRRDFHCQLGRPDSFDCRCQSAKLTGNHQLCGKIDKRTKLRHAYIAHSVRMFPWELADEINTTGTGLGAPSKDTDQLGVKLSFHVHTQFTVLLTSSTIGKRDVHRWYHGSRIKDMHGLHK